MRIIIKGARVGAAFIKGQHTQLWRHQRSANNP